MVSPLGIYRFSRSFLKVALGPLSVLLWFMDPFSFGIISRLASYTCAIMAQFDQRQGEMFRSSLLKSLQRAVVTYQSRASPPGTVGISDPKMDSQLCSSCTFCGVAGLFVFRARS
ncbi:hypothetical protein FRC02_001453 [Tulasnella sp. 418]|nr:hypothetical protein FRC02_001453 [Tulasnella sp. 418]